ncbi:MAG: HAMP domain-containing histidine kinase [Alphaproteobacteria bacterium]|nr:HAMP domain-containing histidine kinase [Alphaproteobacteria bacterium]MCW5741657.1 HAMP domain-containing histidine kinase [Alphaproteobacteria bacterium]
MKWRPRLRTLLLVANFVLLALPLTGVWLLRLYESALIRQTESELMGQAALIAAMYRVEWLRAAPDGAFSTMPHSKAPPPDGPWQPIQANLDLADDPILPEVVTVDMPKATPHEVARRVAGDIKPVLLQAQRQTLAGIRILDHRGVVVGSTGEDEGRALDAMIEVARALEGRATAVMRRRPPVQPEFLSPLSISRGANVRVFASVPVIEDGRVLGAILLLRTPRTLDQALHGKRYELVALLALMLVAGIGMAAFMAFTVSGPVTRVVAQARRVASGERGAVTPLPHRFTREVAELSASLQTMADTLERRADYIRDFTVEVGHEFKTPLASMKGALELLREDLEAMPAEDRQRFLDNMVEDVERLDRLTRRLLDLAHADALAPRVDARCEISAALASTIARHRELGMTIQVESDPPATAAIDGETLSSVVSLLLDNVRQHVGLKATVRIGWTVTGGRVRLSVADDGPGISAGNRDRIFDRFFTTARETGGTGLGLPIARANLAAYGGDIALKGDAASTEFVIHLAVSERR